MQLILSEEQEMIASTARDFMEEKSPVSRFRALRDDKDPIGYSQALWKEMAELGWTGIPFSEEYGGSDMGLADLVVVLEAAGRNLAPEPFLSSVLLAGSALQLGGSEEQKKTWLSRIADGTAVLSLGYQESHSRFDLTRVRTRATQTESGWKLDGEKIQVLDANAADAVIVSARTSGEDGQASGITLFLLPSDTEGLRCVMQHRVDDRPVAIVRMDGVTVPASAVIGEVDRGSDILEPVIDRATVGLCAEMLGGMHRAFELSLEHIKQREQFDTLIGTFQALKHRAARLYVQLELARSVVMGAARAIDEDEPKAKELVSLAKARCSDAYVEVANEAVQFFGGVGMTDEYDIGFYMKRARAAELTFGDAAYHRDRWAQLRGY